MTTTIWKLKPSQFDPAVLAEVGATPILAGVLAARFPGPEEAVEFITYSAHLLPGAVKGVPQAGDMILKHVTRGSRILISGDYDADGITSTAILWLFLKKLRSDVLWHLPQRSQGYGLGMAAVEKALDSKASLLVAVDCGTNDHAVIDTAREKGLEVVVIDHHEPLQGQPRADAFVNPCYYGDDQPYCAAGLVYKVVEYMAGRLGRSVDHELAVLAGIGTVADVVPLLGENRTLVKRALDLWPLVEVPWLTAARRVWQVAHPTAFDIAWQVGPRFNAPGRMASPHIVMDFILTDSLDQALELAEKIDAINEQRKEATEEAEAGIIGSLIMEPDMPAIVVASEDVGHGLAGIIAGRLSSKYRRPAVVLAREGNIWRGSARAPEGYNLTAALEAVSGLLATYGGHKYAAGLSLHHDNLNPFCSQFPRVIPPPRPVAVDIDLVLERNQSITAAHIADLKRMEPFGEGNRSPLFLMRGVTPLDVRTMGAAGEHARFRLGRDSIALVWFNGSDSLKALRPPLDIVFRLDLNVWNDNAYPQGLIETAAPSMAIDRDVVGAVYRSLVEKRDCGLPEQQRVVALAVLEELGLIRYRSGRVELIPVQERRELTRSGIYQAYAS